MPDVGRAISINQMNWDRNRENRMEELTRRRGETYAIRDLWLNMHRGNPRLVPSSAIRPPSDSFHSRNSLSSQSCNHSNATHRQTAGTPSRNPESQGAFPSVDDVSRSVPANRKFRNKDTLIPYHTAITMPPDKKNVKRYFNALNRKLVCSLPHVYDVTHFRGYTSRDVREWKNEIKKIVPTRPTLFLPADATPRSASALYPPYNENVKDPACFFRPVCNDKITAKGREYMINPEWPSERSSPRSARFRSDNFELDF